MEEESLIIFALSDQVPPLRSLQEPLRRAGYPVTITVGIAGEADPEELAAPDWEAAFVRWTEPEIHEVWLLERTVPGEDEQTDLVIKNTLGRIADHPDVGGRMIVSDHIRRTKTLYGVEILPAPLEDADHQAWEALNVLLTALSQQTEGLIYARTEGFYDETGEPILLEEEEEAFPGLEDE